MEQQFSQEEGKPSANFQADKYWDQRFSEEVYIYGKQPNAFLKEQLNSLSPGKVLFIAEGEGRNAVYAASLGWEVHAMDFSKKAKSKALELANEKGVQIHYEVADLGQYTTDELFDLIVFIFVPTPPGERKQIYQAYFSLLAPKGKILVEFFDKKQLGNPSGGPKHIDWLMSIKEFQEIFGELTILHLAEKEFTLDEGPHHQGKANTIRLLAQK